MLFLGKNYIMKLFTFIAFKSYKCFILGFGVWLFFFVNKMLYQKVLQFFCRRRKKNA